MTPEEIDALADSYTDQTYYAFTFSPEGLRGFADALLAASRESAQAETDPTATDNARDAARYRWLCDGNGYFLEEQMLCGHRNEKALADAAIDAAIKQTEKGPQA